MFYSARIKSVGMVVERGEQSREKHVSCQMLFHNVLGKFVTSVIPLKLPRRIGIQVLLERIKQRPLIFPTV